MPRKKTMYASNIYIDTDDKRYVLQLSACSKYIRVVNLVQEQYNGWTALSGTAVKRTKEHWFYVHRRKDIKYTVNLKFQLPH